MATIGANFVLQNKVTAAMKGATLTTAPYVEALEPNAASLATGRVPGGAATGVLGTSISNNGNFLADRILIDLAKQSFAKNGAYHKTTVTTTGVTVDLTDLTSGATSYAGDTAFATVNQVTFYNCGAADMTIAPGASNPADLPKFTGTTPTLKLAAGSAVVVQSGAAVTVDSTHKTILITPTAGGDIVITVGGA